MFVIYIDQKYAMKQIINGNNIFLTGSAGTGKSYILHEVLKIFPKHNTFATACTGVGMIIYTFMMVII